VADRAALSVCFRAPIPLSFDLSGGRYGWVNPVVLRPTEPFLRGKPLSCAFLCLLRQLRVEPDRRVRGKSKVSFRLLQQLLKGLLQCSSRESASASRHTRRKPSAKEKHCPWLKQAVSVPTMGVYHPRPTRSSRSTRRPNRTRRALASWRCPDPPRRFSCLSPAVLTARCHATPSPPSLRSLPQKCRAWVSNCRALSNVPRSVSKVPRLAGRNRRAPASKVPRSVSKLPRLAF